MFGKLTRSEATRIVRSFLCRVLGKPTIGIMPKGQFCVVDDPTMDITHGDVVHPCIRFIEEGFEGHQWWMVYTPYYRSNASLENPRLCYSDEGKGEIPTHWMFYCEISGRPKTGYNSDPTLFFYEGELFVFLRENYTEAANKAGCSRVTRGCRISQKKVTIIEEPLLTNVPRNKDREVCPTFMANDTGFWCYTVNLRFCSKIMYHLPSKLSKRVYGILDLMNDSGIYSRFWCRGVGMWHSSAIDKVFTYHKTLKMGGGSILYHPWHMDLFSVETNEGRKDLFAVVLTNNKHGDICLARSDEGRHLHLYKKPLISDGSFGMNGLYKPSAVVVDGVFMLFYTYLDRGDHINKLLVTTEKWTDVLERVAA